MSEPTFICTRCHGEAPMSERREFDARDYCPRCLDDGIEIVTHPMSLDYHMNVMPWPEIVRKARELDYLSHKAGTCGLHVHISRAAFGETEQHQDAAIARGLYFFEKHWEELLKFSRRTQIGSNGDI